MQHNFPVLMYRSHEVKLLPMEMLQMYCCVMLFYTCNESTLRIVDLLL